MTDDTTETDLQTDHQGPWKNRYYDALNELEAKEKSWQEVERLLRQLISRLTLAADTRHEILTGQLKELRNAVRDGREILQLRELIEGISENVAELDRLRKKDSSRSHPANMFADIIEQLTIPDQLSRSFKQLKKKAKKLKQTMPADSLNDEFIALLKDIIDPPEAESKKSRKSRILDRILARGKKADSEELPEKNNQQANGRDIKPAPQKFVAPAVGDLLLQLALRLPDAVKRRINFPVLKKHTNKARARKDLIAIVDVISQQIESAYINDKPDVIVLDDESIKALSESIKLFFEQLEPPTDLQEQVCKIEEYFSDNSDDVESLIHCINSVAEVVADICSRLAYQHQELEGFFIHLTTRLKDIDVGLSKVAEQNALSASNNQDLDMAVQAEIDGIIDSIQTINDSEPLKEKIRQNVDAISAHLQTFQDTDATRIAESDEQIKKMTEKIAKMEVDSEHLRSNIEETQHQEYKDVLTGIPNRYAYELRLSEEIARCRRYDSDLCLIVWDVDNFKRVNDSYGHAAGDRVLKVIAETLNGCIRETDFLARFGGEEFILLLPGTSIEATQQVAEKLRETIAETAFLFRASGVSITISGGIAQLRKDESSNSLFERADKALNLAKENGRNLTEVAE